MPAEYAPYLRYICIAPDENLKNAYQTYCFDTLVEAQEMMAQNPNVDWLFLNNADKPTSSNEPEIIADSDFIVKMSEANLIYEGIHGTVD
jgi:hypothetical protein